jgi:DNA polymerase I-like protein with 3'-5' exonuclease and polymerase domains
MSAEYLEKVPYEIIKEYNCMDCVWTLKLYESITKAFAEEGYDWTVDHGLYLSMVNRIIGAQIRGILIDRNGLEAYQERVEEEIEDITTRLYKRFGKEIEQVRQILLQKANAKRKKKMLTEPPAFNIASKDHLAMLCVDVLGMEVKKTTPSGKASFRAADLHLWGDVGKILGKRGKRCIVLQQCKSVLEFSEADGRFHPSIKVTGTVTGRLASGEA